VRPGNLAHLYLVRLRARLLQECFAVVGIAAGVALLFASQVASSSLSSSVAQLSHGVVGRATLQLIARDPHGMGQAIVAQARRTPGVRVAAPLLEASANARGPKGQSSVELVGADETLARLGGSLATRTRLAPFAGVGAVVLPAALARTLGVTQFGQEVTLEAGGRITRAPLYAQLGAEQIGGLAATPLVIAPLFYAQEASGLEGRVTRILVESAPGREAEVRAALTRLAGTRANLEGADYDERLFALAATATNQSTALFAVISALVGFLFAFNAMLLSVPQRRRLIAELRRDGYQPRSVIVVMLLDAAVLGVLACALGLGLGEELSIHLFHSNPGYLSSAFTVGSQRAVSTRDILVAVLGGMLAAAVAVLSPLRDILSRDPLAAITPKGEGGGASGVRPALAGLACLAAATAILLGAPKQAVLGMVLLVAAMLLTLTLPLNGALALVRRLAPAIVSVVPHVAVMELRAGKARAVAIAATGAIAVFGSVAIETAHGDLLRGLEGAAHDMNAFTDVWVSPSGSFNLLKTAPFTPTAKASLARLPGVRAVRIYRGGLLDWGTRRIWVIAPPTQATPLLPPGQIVEGDVARASREVRGGGWAVVSRAIADEHHLRIGSAFEPPSPIPTVLRVAAIITNIGWAPGAIIMSSDQYARAWGSADASAYNLLAAPGTTPAKVASEVRRALGANSGLTVETAQAHAGEQRALSRQGLQRLTQIATLILVAAVLAMAAAMGSMVWQRRARLAKLKLEGLPRATLWRTILLESLLLLGVGCLAGAVFGLYGQVLLDRALAQVIGFPVFYSFGGVTAAVSLAVVTAAAVAIAAVPGYLAAGVAPAVALED
jgi:putative ABC transport system permease protein